MRERGHVGVAKGMIDSGRGNETERFADHEGSKGSYPIVTSAAIYYDWFNPDGQLGDNSQANSPVPASRCRWWSRCFCGM